MPVFGKSLFETVLEGLGQTDETEEEDDAPAPVRGFNGSFVGRDWSARPEIDLDPSLLFDGYPPDPIPGKPDVPPAAPSWIDRLSEQQVADDLRLKDCRSADDLREKRRLFAFDNHPDRVPPAYRNQANRRMTIANQLIDAAIARHR